METIETILNFTIFIPLIALVILCFLLLREVDDCRDEIKYLKSVCEQAVQVSEQTEKKLNEHISKSKHSHKKAFIIGYEKGKRNNEKIQKIYI